ncbi:tRNA lysidine(34) synthetase TilS [Neobacillus sp. FSL H8-0543]|uniref:tRNA lysidine(34) synthetase TilS n=1 Tax=Neobacillus sp. FSL H8-0543 TaxID=2954672 RepID=UPI00315949D7
MFEEKVAAFLNRHSFSLKDKQMVIGVSGGPDSLALLHYLWRQQEKENLSIAVAHVDHMFRGQESLEDGLFVKSLCDQYNIPFEMKRINVPELIERTKKSSQTAAREARYDFYDSVMIKYRFPYLALGHHGDDQMETILMRLTRGSSGTARAGIPFLRTFGNGFLFRPFLPLTKAEIEDYCKRNHLTPRRDPSNDKSTYTRNRFRKEVIPFLKSENQQVHEHFQRFSEELQRDELFLQELTIQEMNKVMEKREKNKITIDITRFLEVPIPLQRRGIQLILNYLYKEKPASLSAQHVDQVFSLIQHSHPSGMFDLPNGLKIIRSYSSLSFQFDLIDTESFYYELAEPGIIELPSGCSIKMEKSDGYAEKNDCYAVFDASDLQLPVTIRTRKQGDRMSLKGMTGTKKLKDIFIDCKIPLQNRDTWPVVTDGNGSILWLPGLKKSSFEGIKHASRNYIILTYHT